MYSIPALFVRRRSPKFNENQARPIQSIFVTVILTSGTGDSAYCLAVRQGSKGLKSSNILQAIG
ncbi:hypothetical protein IQ218_12900 [Synechocystis salina LEGE 06099]|uniref:hypothetical protein n=1 Tax=Synechocystis salina TaxID=945780 RepID=UPI00187DDD66|nr:hypothetical protein [Synechocystis salina]MBE9204168.1 hypothetical protein [Synechocystis salina LEGE 06099]